MRRLVGAVSIAAGVVVLTLVAAEYASAALARDRARAAWAELDGRRAALSARASVETGAPFAAALGTPVLRLRIPSIGLDEVVVEGVGERELRAGPGHLPQTPLPGDRGNAVISAHRDRHFRALGALHPGDTVETETLTERATWVVTGRRVVGASAPVLFQSAATRLTLTTCWPIRYFGPAPDRLLVEAERVYPRTS